MQGMCMALAEETGTVTASALVMRTGPGLTYELLGEIPYGAELAILHEEDGWYHVRYDDQYGYVHGRYVRISLPEGQTWQPEETPYVPLVTAVPIPAGTMPPGMSLPPLTFTGENNPAYPAVLMPGDMGNSVLDLQNTLNAMGYPTDADGQYGYDTQANLMRLQREYGIDADGIVGLETRQRIGGDGSGDVELLDWWKGGNLACARLSSATVVDVFTGVRFEVQRYGGDNHFDAEPLTTADTAIFRQLVGGEWDWIRRPIWVEVSGRVIAASMNSMPHGGQHIWDNNYDGHFCIHFYMSRTHDTDRVDENHAACVQTAYSMWGSYY